MATIKDSITCVFNGDWNSLYAQPEWIAQNVFEQDTLEVAVNGFGNNINVLFKCNNVLIHPSQSQVIFTLLKDCTKDSFAFFCQCINNYIRKAQTTSLISYGFNLEFSDNSDLFATITDNLKENRGLIESGCEIVSTKIVKTVKYHDSVFILDSSMENGETKIRINEHHEGPIAQDSYPEFTPDTFVSFITHGWDLVTAIGYEKEEE